MNPITELNQAFVAAMGWTLIHSLWIGSVCAMMVGAALARLKRATSRFRYAVACAGLIALVALLGLTFAFEWSATGKKADLGKMRPAELEKNVNLAQPTTAVSAPKRLTLGTSGTLEKFLPQLVLIWTAGVVLFSIRNLRAWSAVRRLRRTAESVSDAALESRVWAFAARLAIARPVKLLKSAALEIPVAIGWLRPVVILPLSTLSGLAPRELEAILIHELAHISRHDYLVNLVQAAAETILFYHPAVWWFSCRIREEREDCCDDIVIALQGDRATYAKALASLEECRAFSPQLGVAATAGGLLRRIRRIASGRREAKVGLLGIVTGVVVLGCLVAFVGSHTHAFAVENPGKAFEVRKVIENDHENGAEYGRALERLKALREEREELLLKFVDEHPAVKKNAQSIAETEALRQKLENENAGLSFPNSAPAKSLTHASLESLKKEFTDRSQKVAKLEAELQRMRHDLRMSERAIEEANHGNGETIKNLEREKISATLSLLEDRGKRDQLLLKPRVDRRNLIPTLNPDSQLSSLMEAESKVDQQLAATTTGFGDNHPEVVSLKTLKATIVKQIDERIEGIIEGFNARVRQNQARAQELDALLDKARQEEIEVEDRVQPYLRLKREVERARIAEENAERRILELEVDSRLSAANSSAEK